MSLFVCEKCGCVDNTATSNYWGLTNKSIYEYLEYQEDLKPYVGKPLCSECARIEFKNDSGIVVNGKWHNKFPKEKATQEEINSVKYKGIITI